MKKVILLIIPVSIVLGFNVALSNQNEEECIVGTWISEDDPNSKKIFTKEGKCYDYYENVQDETFNYSIERTSPLCDEEVPVGKNFSYLKLVNSDDTNDYYCYEIISLDEEILQIRFFNRPGYLSFKKE
ncbi:hypothetical protein MHTCC0001_18760 [Flavobacteriaceae bacterium MHTCC 0001]